MTDPISISFCKAAVKDECEGHLNGRPGWSGWPVDHWTRNAGSPIVPSFGLNAILSPDVLKCAWSKYPL